MRIVVLLAIVFLFLIAVFADKYQQIHGYCCFVVCLFCWCAKKPPPMRCSPEGLSLDVCIVARHQFVLMHTSAPWC